MSAPRRPGVLHRGDRVVYQGGTYTVLGLSGTLVRLAEELRRGPDLAVHMVDLQCDPTFEIVGTRGRPPLPPSGLMDGLPDAVVQRALWWERHVWEVIYGLPPEAPQGAPARAEYDPARWTLTQRERAKTAELTAAGHKVTANQVKRQRRRYEDGGLRSLVDRRTTKPVSGTGRADPRIVTAMREAIAETADSSSRTAGYILWRTEQILQAAHGDETPAMPPKTTAYRLFGKLADKHTTGSARTRRSLAARPEGPFGQLQVDAPGEVMQIDSTPLDVMVLLDGRGDRSGRADRNDRRCDPHGDRGGARPTTKSVDASVLLARTVTPEPMRPGLGRRAADVALGVAATGGC